MPPLDHVSPAPSSPPAHFFSSLLELAPLHWRATRDRLDPQQLHAELGPLRIPDPPQ